MKIKVYKAPVIENITSRELSNDKVPKDLDGFMK